MCAVEVARIVFFRQRKMVRRLFVTKSGCFGDKRVEREGCENYVVVLSRYSEAGDEYANRIPHPYATLSTPR